MEITLNKENFEEEVLKSDLPVLVDFGAEWCGPCRMVEPIVDEIAKEYEGKIKVGKVNVDQNQELASQYSVMSIPAFKIFKDGKVVSEFVGALPKERIVEEIESALKG